MVWNRLFKLWQPLITDNGTITTTTTTNNNNNSNNNDDDTSNSYTIVPSYTPGSIGDPPKTTVHPYTDTKHISKEINFSTFIFHTRDFFPNDTDTTTVDNIKPNKFNTCNITTTTTTNNNPTTTTTTTKISSNNSSKVVVNTTSSPQDTPPQSKTTNISTKPQIPPTHKTSNCLNKVYPKTQSLNPSSKPVTEMNRKNPSSSSSFSSKKMGWKQKNTFKPLPQDDEDDDWDTDNNHTEEDILLSQTDEELDLSLGKFRLQPSGTQVDAPGIANSDFRYSFGLDDFYRERDDELKKNNYYSHVNDNDSDWFCERNRQGLSSSNDMGFRDKAFSVGSKTTYSNFSVSARTSQVKSSVIGGSSSGSSSSGGDGGGRSGSVGSAGSHQSDQRSRPGENGNSEKRGQGRVIATPWGAAWIGKRKKGVTYCTPDRRKGSGHEREGQGDGRGQGCGGGQDDGYRGGDGGGGGGRVRDRFGIEDGRNEGTDGFRGRLDGTSGEVIHSDLPEVGGGEEDKMGMSMIDFGDNDLTCDLSYFRGDNNVQGNDNGGHRLDDDDFVDDDDDDDDDDWDLDDVCDSNCPLLSREKANGFHSPALSAFSGQRRSSFTSSTSSKESYTSQKAPGRRARHHLASLSIDDLTGSARDASYGDVSGPMRSPGLVSTASMWSTSDLNKEVDVSTGGGTNSLSNVSGSFNERMHELVRAFSERTQRTKEKISQPPTPSSDSDVDAKSGTSAVNEPTGNRNIRLGSFLPLGSRTSEASDGNQDHFVGVWHCKFKMPRVLKKLKFPTTIEPHSKTYVSWLFIVTLAFMYNACVIPLRGVFPYQTSDNVRYWLIADYFCDLIYLIDISVFKIRLRFASHGIVQCDRKQTTKHYMKKLMFKFDILSLTPLDLLYFIEDVGVNPWLRLGRLLKIQTFWEFYEKCDQSARSSAPAIRIIKTMTYMLFLIHIETCGYYAMSKYEGIGTNQWVYNGKGIAYIRCFYLATKTATSIGNNPKPINELEYGFMTLYWLSGVFVFALLIGQIRDIVEAAGLVKDNYRKKMDACLWYMQSINMPNEMQNRVREWFLYNWDQQKTIDEQSLVSTLPKKLQTDLAINVHFQTLSKVQLFQDCEKNLLFDLVLKLKPILFLPGDYICKKGEVGKEMYIVTQGQVEVVGGANNETVLATLYEGSVFGEISLLAMSGRGNRRTADVRSKGYTNVFTLSKHDFEEAMTEYPEAQSLLKKRAKKLLKANAKMERKHKQMEAQEIIKTPSETPKLLRTVIQVMDPDSNLVKQLESSIKRGSSHPRRPVSRSHSHRLSPSQSGLQHLTPPRSHSYRHTSKSPSATSLKALSSLKALTSMTTTPQTLDKPGLDSDDQEEETVFQESSDELSLSEVFQDTGATSSFDDEDDDYGDADNEDNNFDDEEDELLIIEQCEDEEEEEEEVKREASDYDRVNLETKVCWEECAPRSDDDAETNEMEKNAAKDSTTEHPEAGDVDRKQCLEKEKLEPARINVNEDRRLLGSDKEDGRSERSKGESTIPSEDSQDSGLPDVQRSDSRSSSGKKEAGRESRNGSKCNSRNSGRGSRCSMGSNTEQPGTSGKIIDEMSPSNKDMPKKQLELGDSMEDYIEKQIFSDKETKEINMRKSVSAHFDFTSPEKHRDKPEVANRVRKLSVVTPPHSPKDLDRPQNEDDAKMSGHIWGSNTRSQTFSWKDNTASPPNSLKMASPMETIHIRALPPIETSQPLTSGKPYHRSASSIPSLANGLESCSGGCPMVDIPPENRVTCSVEIHRPTSVSTTTTDIHGHIETSL